MMYLEHFGLREQPFRLTPDTAFFFASGPHQEAFNTLLIAVQSGEGFVKVTGEVGTGKTLLCRKLLDALGDGFITCYVPNPQLTPKGLHLSVAQELGLAVDKAQSQHRLVQRLTECLLTLCEAGRRVVVVLDEAQCMPLETLEALRLMTNLETEKAKLMQVVLFGQPELDERLAARSVRQIRQRITFSYALRPLDRAAVGNYVAHRLLVAGSQGQVQFRPAALRELHRASRGLPRLVNVLAHKALMLAYGRGEQTVRRTDVLLAVRDTEAARQPRPMLAWTMLLAGCAAAAIATALYLS